jgi:hypothetical protein
MSVCETVDLMEACSSIVPADRSEGELLNGLERRCKADTILGAKPDIVGPISR